MARVRGLLLVNAKGDRYFIEGGIKAHRIDPSIGFSAGGGPDVSELGADAVDRDALAYFEAEARRAFEKANPEIDKLGDDIKANLGPRALIAFNVFLERDDDGGDSLITGNGHTLSQS